MSTPTDPRIDDYIAGRAAFAQPILKKLRGLIHQACPEVEETIKWSAPFFMSGGRVLCNMAAFKEHVAFGFWHQGMQQVLGTDGEKADHAMGSFGRITSVTDLPPDKKILAYLRQALALNASDLPARAPVAKRPPPKAPEDLAAALKKNKAAAATFEKFPPGQRREYIDWLTEAKRPETREKRLATTIEWLAEGKTRNWQYAKC